MECEICGRKVDKLFDILVEGTKLKVCSDCSKSFSVTIRPRKVGKSPFKLKNRFKNEVKGEEEYDTEVVSKVLREIRMKYGLTQKQLAQVLCVRESIIRRLERGELKPDPSIVKKIEKQFKIEIQPESEEELERILSGDVENTDSRVTEREEPLTLGDIARIRIIKSR